MNLTQAAKITKTSLLILAVCVVVGGSAFISYQVWYYQYYLPAKIQTASKPDVRFGILPKLPLPASQVTSSNYSYSLDTETGSLPDRLPKVLKVYHLPQIGFTLLAPNKSKLLAESLSFFEEPESLTETIYRFGDGNKGELILNLSSGNFSFNRDPSTIYEQTAEIDLPDEESIKKNFKKFLSDRGLLKDSLAEGRLHVEFSGQTQKESTSAAVSIWPGDIEDYPLLTPDYNHGLIKASVIPLNKDPDRYIKMDYVYWEPDLFNSATYPLKSIEEAYEELKSGQGSVVIQPKGAKVSIQSVYLGYFLPSEYTEYLQPIFIFEGDGFVSYIPAVVKEYLEK